MMELDTGTLQHISHISYTLIQVLHAQTDNWLDHSTFSTTPR